jgi:hypothetical protein
MNVSITFEVYAADLNDGINQAEDRLARFLSPNDSTDNWNVSLACEPTVETVSDDVPVWRIEVEAVRGIRHGP